MKCPLRTIKVVRDPKNEGAMSDNCLKEECAWWEQDINLCAIKEIALELRYTQQRLGDLSDKILKKKGGN